MKQLSKTIMCILILAQVSVCGQAAKEQNASSSKTVAAASSTAVSNEDMIRSAYEKLMRYQKATVLYYFNGKDEDVPKEDLVEFKLTNFHYGPFTEITDKYFDEFLTPPSDEILDFSSGHKTENNGPPEAHYSAKWMQAPENQKRPFRPKISDLYVFEGSKYFDVGHYATYDVSVSYKGKSKTYKAAAVFHDLYESAKEPRPEFWDLNLENSVLYNVQREKAPPFQGKDPSFQACPRSEP
jgi:hypothetical protein